MPFPQLRIANLTAKNCSVLLLTLWGGLCLTSELAARFAFPKISRVYRRIESERKAVLNLNGQRPGILFVGNSLFEKGLVMNAMQEQMSGYEVRRYVISATSSLDWYYGLRKVMDEGVRPQFVVGGFSARQLLTPSVEGDLSVHLLVRTSDIKNLGHELHTDNTALSELYFANLSGFYGARTQFRKWLLAIMMPDIERLAVAITPPNQAYVFDENMIESVTEQLKRMNQVCSKIGARFILVVPPTQSLQDAAAVPVLREAGRRAGVDVLFPIAPGELSPTLFADGIHLTPEGALRFTSTLSSDLRKAMTEQPTKEQHSEPSERVAQHTSSPSRG